MIDRPDPATENWLRQNSTLFYFLIAQFIAIGAGAASVLAYMVKLEVRVHTMETRGAEFTVARMDDLKLRIAQQEQATKKNEESIQRIIDVMTRELRISPNSPGARP
jgi:hypothetical protein